jgi:hypothetical protein
MTPFYTHLSGVPGFGDAADIDRIGLYATAAVAGAFAAHSLVQIGRRQYDKKKAEKAEKAEKEPVKAPPAPKKEEGES